MSSSLMYTDHIGSNPIGSSPSLGMRCGETLSLRILELGPESSFDITVAQVKCRAERGFVENVGALLEVSGRKR